MVSLPWYHEPKRPIKFVKIKHLLRRTKFKKANLSRYRNGDANKSNQMKKSFNHFQWSLPNYIPKFQEFPMPQCAFLGLLHLDSIQIRFFKKNKWSKPMAFSLILLKSSSSKKFALKKEQLLVHLEIALIPFHLPHISCLLHWYYLFEWLFSSNITGTFCNASTTSVLQA